MTCIVALVDKDKIYMGADTFGSNSYCGRAYKEKKIIKKKDMLIGVCGSYKVMNILTHEFTPPRRYENEKDRAYIHRVGKSISNLLGLSADCLENSDTIESSMIIGYNSELYVFQSDGSVLNAADPYATAGSGAYHAEASLYSTQGTKDKPRTRLKKAIVCASEFVVSVNGDFQIEVI